MDMMLMLNAAALAPAVAKYLGIVEDKLANVEAKVDRLGKSEFEAGVRALLQAGDSEVEKMSLLREARNRFNQAVGLETGVRLVHAYLGLALCHKHLGDVVNMVTSLKALTAVPTPIVSPLASASKAISDSAFAKTAIKSATKLPWWSPAAVIAAAPILILLPAAGVAAGVVMAAQAGTPAYDRWAAEVQHMNELKENAESYMQDNSVELPQCPMS